jgi:YYY domain-containing protein
VKETLYWWLAAEAVGAAAFPLAFAYFRFLPERGYGLSKVLGLLLVGYALWIGGSVGLLTNRQGSVILLLLLMALASLWVVAGRRQELAEFLRCRWHYLAVAEILFAAAFFLGAWLRAFVPEIAQTEKPMEFMVLNAVMRSDHFPAHDPWLSGHSMSYYYFGYLIVSTVAKLTATSASVAFNLGIVVSAALMITAGFSLIYNLLAGMTSQRRAVAFALLGGLLPLIIGNVEGMLELLAAHGVGSDGFYHFLDISGLDAARHTDKWYPTEWLWWYRASRIATPAEYTPFPFFSVLDGALHSEVLSLPFVVLAMAVAFHFLRSPERLGGRYWLAHPWMLVATGVILGALAFLQIWDLLTFGFLLVLAALVSNVLQEKRLSLRALRDTATFAAPLLALAVVAYAPFYAESTSGVSGIGPQEAAINFNLFPPEAVAARLSHFLLFWMPLIWLPASLVVAGLVLRERRANALLRASRWLLLPLAIFVVWAIMIGKRQGLDGLPDELDARGWGWLTFVGLALLLAAAASVLARHLTAAASNEGHRGTVFALTMVVTALLLIFGAELFYVQEPIGTRHNTVFKFYYQAWLLFGLASAFALCHLTRKAPVPGRGPPPGRWAWLGLTAVILAAGLVYPVSGTFYRTGDLGNRQTLDGMAWLRQTNPSEYQAIRWLNENVKGTPVILEAVGDIYTSFGRISSGTGLPTVLEWPRHEEQWRGSSKPFEGRWDDVERAYNTLSVTEAQSILDKYNVKYVYVGWLEREHYDPAGLAKFGGFMDVEFRNEAVTIYRAREGQEAAVRAGP